MGVELDSDVLFNFVVSIQSHVFHHPTLVYKNFLLGCVSESGFEFVNPELRETLGCPEFQDER